MQYFEISYRRSYYLTDKKYVKSLLGVTDAIRKTKLKGSVTDVVEITEEQYKKYKAKQKALKEAKKARKNGVEIVGCTCGKGKVTSMDPDEDYGQYYITYECKQCGYYWEGFWGHYL